jgi:hypothetical protein
MHIHSFLAYQMAYTHITIPCIEYVTFLTLFKLLQSLKHNFI